MNPKYLILWLLVAIPAIIRAQPAGVDSLRMAAQHADPAIRLNALAALSESYRNLHPDTTFTYARQVVDSPDTAACPRCAMRAYNMLGTVAMNKGDYKEAIGYYHHARDIARSMSLLKAEAAILNNISIIHTKQGNYEKAIENLRMSLYVKVLLGDSLGAAASSLNIGAIYTDTKQPELARQYLMRAERIYRASEYQHELATTLNNIGLTYDLEKVYDKALPYYMESLRLRRDLKDSVNLYLSLSTIADVFIRKNQPEKSIEYVTQSIHITEQYGMEGEAAGLYAQQAEICQLMGDYACTHIALSKALIIANNLDMKPLKQDIGEIYGKQGEIYLSKKQYPQADTALRRALALAEQIANKPLEHEACKILAEVYSQQGDLNQARLYRKRQKSIARALEQAAE